MKSFLIVIMLIFTAKISSAQVDNFNSYADGIIHYNKPTAFKSGYYTLDGQTIKQSKINDLLKSNSASSPEFNQFIRYRNTTYYLSGASLGFIIAAAIASKSSDNIFATNSSKILFSVSIGTIISGFVFAHKRNKHYAKAIQLYNQQLQ